MITAKWGRKIHVRQSSLSGKKNESLYIKSKVLNVEKEDYSNEGATPYTTGFKPKEEINHCHEHTNHTKTPHQDVSYQISRTTPDTSEHKSIQSQGNSVNDNEIKASNETKDYEYLEQFKPASINGLDNANSALFPEDSSSSETLCPAPEDAVVDVNNALTEWNLLQNQKSIGDFQPCLSNCNSVCDIPVEDSNYSQDEIVLRIQDESGILSQNINLDTLSRFDSKNNGNNCIKFKYILPFPSTRDFKILKNNQVKYINSDDLAQIGKKKKRWKNLKLNKTTSRNKSAFRLWGVIISYYSLLIGATYFLMFNNPIWEGLLLSVWNLIYNQENSGYGFIIWIVLALVSIVPPMFTFFEDDEYDTSSRDTSNVALIIPAYKAGKILPKTLSAALKVFPAKNIFVIANGNSVTPLDNTAEVCSRFNVNHSWVPYGCKLGALYVGVCRVPNFKYVVTIDDDCLLPENFPLPLERFKNGVACIGYTITSCGPNFSKGNIVHKLQDIEYKISGLVKQFQGRFGGSAMFPHGAVSMWDREVMYMLFEHHPGYRTGEDWFFGHVAREMGYRIELCSKVFVKTETPRSMFIAPKMTRGGFGELTVAKQRMFRWNYFLLKCMMDNFHFIIFCWKMPKWHYNVLSKIWALLEIIHTLQYIIFPLIIPLFLENTLFTLIVTGTLVLFSLFLVILFNFLHLGKKKNARVGWIPVFLFIPYMMLSYFTNFFSHMWALFHYGIYYSRKHLRITKIPEVISTIAGK